ncbi:MULTISPECIES: LpxL/LpxP family acyltransferase [unclassified Luteococcus]|uniref:LpxL/LpxP family acyltransferase n=1 Tax=unclassified Luteococcus TaxID=2639923 RepID=UPI00313C178F
MTLTRMALTAAEQVPAAVLRPLAQAGGRLAALHPPRGLRQWQLNVATMTGQQPSRQQTSAAAASWARNLAESAQLGRWTPEQVLGSVRISPADRERLLGLHATTGVVAALPHMGSWDLAGAWACLNGLPVSTVAEEIPEFDYFVGVRQALGMRVYGLRDPRVVARLAADRRAGRLVCLLSDRYFGRGGVPVRWPTATGPVDGRLPGGAAHLALSTGASLLGIASHYEPDGMRLVVSQPLRGQSVEAMVQQLADFFAGQIRNNPTDWHMMQPLFPGRAAG